MFIRTQAFLTSLRKEVCFQENPDSMKSQTTAERVLQLQTIMVYLLLISVIIVCAMQIPHIADFIREYRDTMKAALPLD